MFVYQNDKLYVQSGDKVVWVEIYPDLSFTITDEVAKLEPNGMLLNAKEVQAKFNFPSMEPVERKVKKAPTKRTPKKEVKSNESTDNTKKPTRKRTSK